VNRRRVYLDHAATSWPKPPGVLEACAEYQTTTGAAASRGAYRSSRAADAIVADARAQLANVIHAAKGSEIAFTSNGTMALNAAILGLLHPLDLSPWHVVTTAIEHNSVLRPLAMLEQTRGLRWTAVPCDTRGRVDPTRIQHAMRPETRLVIVNHGSNVTGAITDVARVSEIAHRSNAWLLVDAAQTVGYASIDVEADGIDLLAAPCHKGVGGMLGTGFVYATSQALSEMRAPWIGGTGNRSDSLTGAFSWSEGIESGNLNVPGIASVGAGLRWLSQRSHNNPWREGVLRMVEEIEKHPQLHFFGPDPSQERLPVISLTSDRLDCHEMAMVLESAMGIEARSGFHCAALIHEHLGTCATGGTLRLSLGHTSTEEDVEAACEGIRLLASC